MWVDYLTVPSDKPKKIVCPPSPINCFNCFHVRKELLGKYFLREINQYIASHCS